MNSSNNTSINILDIEDIHEECARGCQYNTVTKKAVGLLATKLKDKDKFLQMMIQKLVDTKEESKQRGLELEKSKEESRHWKTLLEQNQKESRNLRKEVKKDNEKHSRYQSAMTCKLNLVTEECQGLREENQKLKEEVEVLRESLAQARQTSPYPNK